MQASTRVLVSIVIFISLVMGLYFFSAWFSKTTGYTLGEDQKIQFSQCLADNGASLYITEDCWECEEQAKILGTAALAHLNVVTCDVETLCSGLESVPAWEVDGTFAYGKKTFEELDELSTCSIV